MITNCLTYNQLQAYSEHSMNKTESEQLYKHISVCELCACAVNGFSAIPFSSDELVAIHREIDGKVNAAAKYPLTLAQVFIVTISLFSIIGVYHFSNHSIVQSKIESNLVQPKIVTPTPRSNETKIEPSKEISAITKTFKKIIQVIEHKKFERTITPVEALEPIDVSSQISEQPMVVDAEDVVLTHADENVIYIYDLKIADYNKLYFGLSKDESNLFKTHVPVFKENRESISEDLGLEEHVIPADRVLKDGLAEFNNQQFGNALENFNLLLENNPNDVNAKFYSALSYYNLNKVEKCIQRLKSVLESPNKSFYPEAQWYLALVNIKSGDKPSGKKILETIVLEKGFYSKRAKEILKTL